VISSARLPLASAVLALLTTTGARADGLTPKDEALDHYNKGVALIDAGRNEEAFPEFERAYTLYPKTALLFNLARIEQLTGRNVRAYRHYRQYQREATSASEEKKKTLRAYLEELAQKVGQIQVVAPRDVTVKVDGTEVDRTEPYAVEIGPHTVSGTLNDWSGKTSVVAEAGRITTAAIAFEKPDNAGAKPEERAEDSSAKTISAVAVFGAAGALLATGGILRLIANGQQGAASPSACWSVTSPDCQSIADAADRRTAFTNVSTAALVGGAVALGAGIGIVILWRTSDGAKTRDRAWIAPLVTGGASVGGSF
jgi:tetratricopeptide (TPR) repeat protein